jgi:hypothetical protein
MATYLVLGGGVNGRQQAPARETKWSIPAVESRANISRSAVEKALLQLERHGFITPRAAGNAHTQSESGWSTRQIDPEHVADVAIANRFLAKVDELQPRKGDQPCRGSLAALMCHTRGKAGIDYSNAVVDALLVFVALHRHQDLDRFGGVDPTLVGSRCTPIDPDEDGLGTQHVVRLRNFSGDMALVTERSPDMLSVNDQFAETVLGCVPPWRGAPSTAERFRHALEQLEGLGLVYRTHVVWSVDPIMPPAGRHPRVLYTLHVARSWASELEGGVADCIHSKFCLATPEQRQARFAESRGEQVNWHRSGIFRFAIPYDELHDAQLMVQFRARWWPLHGSTLRDLQREQARNALWRETFEACYLRG